MKTDKIQAVLKGILGAYLLTAVILLLLAFLLYRFQPTGEILRIGIVFTYLFSSFIGGILAGRKTKEKRFLWGLLVGMLYFAMLLLVSVVMGKEIFSAIKTTLTVFFMCAFGGMLGGMIS